MFTGGLDHDNEKAHPPPESAAGALGRGMFARYGKFDRLRSACGTDAGESVIDAVFQQFCVGK